MKKVFKFNKMMIISQVRVGTQIQTRTKTFQLIVLSETETTKVRLTEDLKMIKQWF